MNAQTITEPRAYVTTWGVYNAGRLVGRWYTPDELRELTPATWATEHRDHLAGLAAFEVGEELAVHDFEGMPADFQTESVVTFLEAVDALEHLHGVGLDDDAVSAYVDMVGSHYWIGDAATIEGVSVYESRADFGASWLEETGSLESVPENLRVYIDFEAWARDALIESEDLHEYQGRVYDFVR